MMDGSEECVLADSRQYSRQSFQNRSRFRTPDGIQWLTVPIQGHQFGKAITRIGLDQATPWQVKHQKALQFNYGSTPFFVHYRDAVFEVITGEYDSLASLTVASTKLCHRLLNLECSIRLLSELPEVPPTDGKRQDNANGSGYVHPEYRQNFEGFIPGMSVLDLLFNHGPESKRILQSGWKP